ncbi:MAG: hypothetical protein LBI04_08240 [Treponema sp.]|jgi:hypothetical protein|nr:hypothetical protein [Treponema sp.]
MKNFIFAVLLTFLLLSPVLRAEAQSSNSSNSSSSTSSNTFDTTGFPQWAKDFRRWDIIAFGVFPFSLFFATVITDLNRWNDANGMDMSDMGRRYAPWPLKSAGAAEMTKDEYEKVLLTAAGISAAIACTDLIITLIKRSKERKRIESRPKSTAVIEISPYGDPPDDTEAIDKDETPETGESDSE